MDDLEDIAKCLAEGRAPRQHGPYQIAVGNEKLDFRCVRIDDPVPTGRQILIAADARPVDEHLVFQVLRDGDLEDSGSKKPQTCEKARLNAFLFSRVLNHSALRSTTVG